jgi:hypothetical protein
MLRVISGDRRRRRRGLCGAGPARTSTPGPDLGCGSRCPAGERRSTSHTNSATEDAGHCNSTKLPTPTNLGRWSGENQDNTSAGPRPSRAPSPPGRRQSDSETHREPHPVPRHHPRGDQHYGGFHPRGRSYVRAARRTATAKPAAFDSENLGCEVNAHTTAIQCNPGVIVRSDQLSARETHWGTTLLLSYW